MIFTALNFSCIRLFQAPTIFENLNRLFALLTRYHSEVLIKQRSLLLIAHRQLPFEDLDAFFQFLDLAKHSFHEALHIEKQALSRSFRLGIVAALLPRTFDRARRPSELKIW